jgi:putative FmdB family regulatory protein
MPTYHYKCSNCGAEIEVTQSMKDEPLVHCPSCEEDTLEKVLHSAGGFRIYGRGVYKSTSRLS